MSAADRDSASILEHYHTELAAIQSGGEISEILRWTGEELAMAGERLHVATDESRIARCAELLVIAHPHVEALSASGMADEALRTQAMAMLTVLHARVSPESFAGLWLQSLQLLCLKASDNVYADPSATGRASRAASEAFGLFLATAHSYMPRYGADEGMRRFYDHLRQISASAGEEVSHFQGHRIVPTMAIDILSDIIALTQ